METQTAERPEVRDDRDEAKRHIAAALRAACAELGWNTTRLGTESGSSAYTAAKWLSGDKTPSGEALLLLMRRHMVVRVHLLGAA